MYPQTYGTYYGKRFPIEVEKQLSATAECASLIDLTRIFLLQLVASVVGTARSLPRTVGKRMVAVTDGAVFLNRAVSFHVSAVCAVVAKTAKHITLIPVSVACVAGGAIKKQIGKVLSAVTSVISSIGAKGMTDVEFIGDFAPGDIVTIDSRTMEVKLGSGNALHLLNGEFLVIHPGEQEIIYSDDEGNRMVRMKVWWKDRWL